MNFLTFLKVSPSWWDVHDVTLLQPLVSVHVLKFEVKKYIEIVQRTVALKELHLEAAESVKN